AGPAQRLIDRLVLGAEPLAARQDVLGGPPLGGGQDGPHQVLDLVGQVDQADRLLGLAPGVGDVLPGVMADVESAPRTAWRGSVADLGPEPVAADRRLASPRP